MTPSLETLKARSASIKATRDLTRKYVHTDATDEHIRNAYRLWTQYNNRRALAGTAKRLGWPIWVIRSRGRVLGLSKTKDRPWTPAEEELLDRYGWMCLKKISDKFRAAGFHRTETAISLKMKRLKTRATLEGWTARQLAQNFGVDDHRITTWIKRGMLRSQETGVGAGQNQKYYIAREDVRRFLLHHPEEFDHAKCEKYFLLGTLCPNDLCKDFLREIA